MFFALKRPFLLLTNLLVNRDRPDLEELRRIEDPERFVWAILPHAARTFSACIALLPSRAALASAVAYLYCRILDTYEDLSPDLKTTDRSLAAFAERIETSPMPPAPPIDSSKAVDERDRAHLLLVECCEKVDRVFFTLPEGIRELVRDLVRDMAEGMRWSARTFEEQRGVLTDEAQVMRYCRAVIGNPVVFVVRLMRYFRDGETVLEPELREHCMHSGEMVQLANITRDIEKDLLRGVAYVPKLAGDLGRAAKEERDAALTDRVRIARTTLLRMALSRAPSYGELMRAMDGKTISLSRASAILMLLFTDRHYRKTAKRVGLPSWSGPSSSLGLLLTTLPAVFSRRRAEAIFGGIEREFLRAATQAVPTPSTHRSPPPL
jgi:phytoene/squalene synthetase